MTIRITMTLLAMFFISNVIGQSTNKDSALAKIRARLLFDRDSLKKNRQHTRCTDFLPCENPKWSDKKPMAKAYYRNCTWSGTYVILNNDSTFLYKHNGEGPGNYLKKGRWQIKGDSILILRGSEELTEKFIADMKAFDATKYKADLSTMHLLIADGNLVFTDTY